MEIRPILSALRRHKTAAVLISLEIALTCAIVCNAVFLIGRRLARIHMPSGIAEQGLLRIQLAGASTQGDSGARVAEDLAALRQLPGVKSVAYSNEVPFGSSSWNNGVRIDVNARQSLVNATTYFGSESLLKTLGVELVAGRDFHPDEFVDFTAAVGPESMDRVSSVIVTRALAQLLWPGQSAVGKVLYTGKKPTTVVGVVDDLVRPSIWKDSIAHDSMLLPVRLQMPVGNYLLRVDPSRDRSILKAAVAKLQRLDPNRVVTSQQTFPEIRAKFFQQDRSMAWLLVTVSVLLLVVTALGIVGLASFWVQQRTRHIGIRRALGATRGDILRYFQTENFLLTTFGIVLGLLFAYGINFELMRHYELTRLPFSYFAGGAVVIWLLGQLAVLGPALRASAVPPALATRSV